MMNVAVVETDVDASSGAATELTAAEVRLLTAELRREAVKNLPRDRYNVMTSETVMAQGSATLVECADENCVIALGSKIGADYIVRGTISKLRARYTLSVEMYETENGNLVASSEPVRSESVEELVEKAAAAGAGMFRAFTGAQAHTAATPAPKAQPPAGYAVTAASNPPYGGTVSRNPDRPYYAPDTRVNVMAVPAKGYKFAGWSGDTTGAAAMITVTVNGAKMLTANFQYVQPAYALTTGASPPDGGAVSRNPDKKVYAPGEKVSVTATPANGYAFTGWTGTADGRTGAVGGRSNRLTVTMDTDKALTANFLHSPEPAARAPEPDAAYETTGKQADYETAPKRRPMTGFSLGSSFNSGDDGHLVAQFGIVHSRPVTKDVVSLNLEGNIWTGEAYYPYASDNVGIFGLNVPVTVLLQGRFLYFEVGGDADLLFGEDQTLFNAGYVAGAGVSVNVGPQKKWVQRYFYRYLGGYEYGAHAVGLCWLF
jgi:hypothetical protein